MDIVNYKGAFIRDFPREESSFFCNDEGLIIEDKPLLVLASTEKVPENIDNSWIYFCYSIGEYDDKYFEGCGMLLPVREEFKTFINTIDSGAFCYYTKWAADKNGIIYQEEDSESYERFIKAYGLSWDKTVHCFQWDAYPIDAT